MTSSDQPRPGRPAHPTRRPFRPTPGITGPSGSSGGSGSSGDRSDSSSGGGRPKTFTNDRVIDVTCRAGLATFSVKGVAREMGISPAAVYQRFGSRRGLLDACLAHVFDLVEPLTGTPDREGTLRRFSDQWWLLCLRCPDIEVVIRDYPDPEIILLTGKFAGYRQRLTDLGLTTEQATFAGSMIAVSMLPLRHRLPGVPLTVDDVPVEVEDQRLRSLEFILATLQEDWPEWSVATGAGTDAGADLGETA